MFLLVEKDGHRCYDVRGDALVKGNFALKDIAKQLMDMRPGELVVLNDRKTIVESEMRHLRKIEGVLIQLRCKMLHALSVYPIKKTLGVRCMFLVCPGI